MKIYTIFAALGLLAVGLSGCSGIGESTEFENVHDLKAAYEEAGGTCTESDSEDVDGLDQLSCDEGPFLSVYSTDDAKDRAEEFIDTARTVFRNIDPDAKYYYQQGDNWFISTMDKELLFEEMGVEIKDS